MSISACFCFKSYLFRVGSGGVHMLFGEGDVEKKEDDTDLSWGSEGSCVEVRVFVMSSASVMSIPSIFFKNAEPNCGGLTDEFFDDGGAEDG